MRIKAEGNTVTLKIYNDIHSESWFDEEDKAEDAVANVEDLEKILKENKNASILDIYINSPGGDVFEGVAIYNILKRNRAYKRVWIDGFACSIASVIAMAGNSINMPKSSMLMIHNPWSMAVGNASELRALADQLDKIAEPMIEAYMSKYTGTRDELVAMLDAETYLTADEAFACGLCTNVVSNNETTQANVEEALDSTLEMYSGKLKQFASIKQSIKDLMEEETAEAEAANEATAEVVNEAEAVNEPEMVAPDDEHTVTKEEAVEAVEAIQQNTLRAFFNVK